MANTFFLEAPKGLPAKCLIRGSTKGKPEKKAVFSSHCGDETTACYDGTIRKRRKVPWLRTLIIPS